ncbi:protein kinase domain-containing protein [Mycobacterium riyadhense]|uniref:Serine/threonine-protein kinase PknK n=1 Tax=Mycobacterium riyadhense TaxID=486698 RepID=A0A653EPH9_9MYCO|nr:protein kinase [Mycobacterium riyadhense]VTO99433.1 Serine/threonine-protein kinase PknK [Mycobacterium riyadhense]
MEYDPADTEAETAAGDGVHGGIPAELAALGFDGAIEVGRGGFGTVYRCLQKALDRVVAVKVVTVERLEDQARFVREQQAMAKLTAHPNIVAVLQVGQTATGFPFLVMPFCGFGSWRERIASAGTVGVADVLRQGVKIAGALECAHRAGVVHRDVKPGNILTTDYGEPALSDFGIARTEGGFKTAPGVFHGSPAFTAPELFAGAPPNAASDVYGLGASLFTGLTGRAAFERRHGEDLLAQFVRITTQPLPDLREHGIPANLAALIEQAMARDPGQRPSALELGQRLQRLQACHGLAVDEMVLHDGEGVDRSRSHLAHSPGSTLGRGPTAGGGLPSLSNSLVGREAELGRLHELLRCSRLVTVTGTGGVGKTALAIHAARREGVDYPDGVWLVQLGDLRDGSRVVEQVVATLGAGDQSARPPIELLVEFLGQRRALIVLDNCEHVIDDAANLVETLLPRCPRLQVVATSREVVAVGGEAVLALSPLAAACSDSGLESLAASDAVTLFVQLARAEVPEFELTEDNAATVARICARLDGLPLAIELAAVRLRTMSLEQIGDELPDQYALLSHGHGNPDTRKQSLKRCIEWSYDLCSESEQQLWARLSVFGGSFDPSAAHYVSGEDLPASEFLDLLCALVDKSILIRADHDGVVCFHLLQTLRAYGRGCTSEAERVRLGRRHANWYHQLLTEAAIHRLGPRQDQWVQRLTRERPNIREALRFSSVDCPAMAMEMESFLRQFGIYDAMLSEGCYC